MLVSRVEQGIDKALGVFAALLRVHVVLEVVSPLLLASWVTYYQRRYRIVLSCCGVSSF